MNFLHRLAMTLRKKANAIAEPVRMKDACNTNSLESAVVIDSPYRHVVIDDLFTQEFYEKLCAYFDAKKEEGLYETKMPGKFHAFLDVTQPYDGYVLSLTHEPDSPMNFFYSNEWNLYFSKLFDRPTDNTTAVGLHFHKPGDKTGWVHNDYALKRFDTKNMLENGVISIPYEAGDNKGGADVAPPNATAFLARRAITLLYYLGNTSADNVGGGTGMYETLKSTVPAKVIAPKNNRLFAFEVTPKSYHAFQSNKSDRSSVAQWFHIDNEWCKKHLKRNK